MRKYIFWFSAVGFFAGVLGYMIGLGDKELDTISIKDEAAIKKLLNEFSILADNKDVEGQLKLFSEDALIETYRNGQISSSLNGKGEIFNAFSNFLSNFNVVYHLNGQQNISVDGDDADAISYCLVILISDDKDQRIKTTFGVSYNDKLKRVNGKWLITNRKSHFNWETNELLDP